MFVAHALMSLTLIAVLAFFVLFTAQKADGLIRVFGRVLGVWLLILGVLAAAAAVTAPMMGGRPFGMAMPGYMRAMHCDGWRQGLDRATPSPPAPPTETPSSK